LSFQPVPSQPDLQARIPAGREAVKAKPFTPPLPSFGPGSLEHTRSQAEQLELLERDAKDISADPLRPPTDPKSSSSSAPYSGSGEYF